MKHHLHPDRLEKYSFLWSEARLVVAAIALFIGGVPPILYVAVNAPALAGLITLGLKLAWIVSGIASAYLLYRWSDKKMLFGKKETLDTVAFFVMVISGFNLGITGVMGTNIGMSITSNYIVFILAAIIYIGSAGYLYKQWKKSGEKLF